MKTRRLNLIITTLTLLVAVAAKADITTGLVGYWSLSDGPGHSTVSDLSGNGNTGTLVNFTDATYQNMWTTTTDPNNGWPDAVTFNQSGEGNNTYISIPDSTTLDQPTANKAWTLSAWVYPTEAGTSEPNGAGIVAKGTYSNTQYAYCIYMLQGKFAGGIRNSANNGGFIASNSVAASANTWYHVVLTVMEPKGSQNSEMSLYVNGQLVYGTNSNTYTTVYSSAQPVTIGCFGASTLPFQGIIDEVRIYNRQLTASDVTQLYNNKANPIVNNGVGYFNGLAGTGGNTTLDAASQNFDTNITSAPLGTPASLTSVLSAEASASLPAEVIFADAYYNANNPVNVTSSNITIATGGVAIGNSSGTGTIAFQNAAVTYTLASSDNIGLKDGANPTALAQSGIGTTILTGNNTYSGGTTVNEGVLQLGNGGATGSPLGSGPVTVTGTLAFDGNDNPTLANPISGSGVVIQNGPGKLTLTGNNSYSGGTTLNNGSLSVNSFSDAGGTASPGTGPVNLNGGTIYYTGTGDDTTRQFNGMAGSTNTIDVGAGNTLEIDGRVTGTAAWLLNKTGSGTLNLGGAADNSFLGVNVNGGTLIVGKSGGTGHAIGNPLTINSGALAVFGNDSFPTEIYSNATAPVTVNSGGALDMAGQTEGFLVLNLAGTGLGGSGALTNSYTSGVAVNVPSVNLLSATSIGASGSISLTGTILGTGPLTFNGTSGSVVLQLAGYNNYSGGTIVNSGTLDANGINSIPDNVTVTGSGLVQFDTAYSMPPTGVLTLPASPAAGTVNLAYNGTMNIGALVIGGVAQPAGTYGSSTSGATFTSATFQGNGVLNVMETYWDANHSDATAGSSAAGGGSGSWDSSTHNWWVSGNTDVTWAANNVAYFGGTAGMVTLSAPESVVGMVFSTPGYVINNTDGTSTLSVTGNNPIVSVPAGTTTIGCDITGGGASVGLTASGPGTLVLSGTNTYTGDTQLTNGVTVSVNSISDSGTSAIGTSGNVIAYGGTISYTGTAPATTARNFIDEANTQNTIDVPATSGALTINGSVSGTNWIKSSAGTLYLGGTNDDPSLGLAINAGEVIITKNSATNVHGLGGGTSSVASGAELQLAGSGGYDLYSGCKLTVASGGIFDLNGQNDSFSTLTIAGAGSGSGVLLNTSATASSISNAGSGVVLAGDATIGGIGGITLNSVVSGSAGLTYAGTAVLTLTNANTFDGGIVINPNATVLLTNSVSSGGTGAITDNGTLDIGISGNNSSLANAISGPGVINIEETVNQNLAISGSLSGFTGTLNCPASASTAKFQILTNSVALTAAPTINVANGGTFYISGSNVVVPCPINLMGTGNTEAYGSLRVENGCTISGPVILHGNTSMGNGSAKLATISGPIQQTNGSFGITFGNVSGTVVLSGTNSFTGPLMISNGVVVVGGSGCLGSTANYAANITNNGAFVYNSTLPQTLSGVVSGSGLVQQLGPGTLSLVNTNTFTNALYISNSTVLLSGAGCLGATATATNFSGTLSNYGTLNYSSAAVQILSGVILGSGSLVQNGPGLLTLSNTEIYTGATTINAGTLALSSAGSIADSASISIAQGAILDVSAYSLSFNLGSGTLIASGSGTGVGTTAATIKGGSGGGAAVTVGATTLNYAPQSFTGDATHPALYVSQGGLNMNGSSLTVNNTTATPLGAGTYNLVQVAGGNLSVANTNVTVTGAGLAAGGSAALSVSGGNLNLVVTITSIPTPAINSVTFSSGSVVFSGTNGPASRNYTVLTSSNLTTPLSNWTVLSTNAFGPSGTFSATNTPAHSPSFYIIKVQ